MSGTRQAVPGALLAVLCLLGAEARADGPSKVECTAEARRALSVTAYRNVYPPLAFVREIRELELPAGKLVLSLGDVPDTVRRETVGLRVLEGGPIEVQEQTFGYDLLSPAALLRAAEGGPITLDHVNAHSGELQPVPAQVIAQGSQGEVLRTAEGYTFGVSAERTRFASMPPQLTARPTLRWLANASAAGKRRIEITYLIRGMSWTADYVATLSRDATKLDLASWVTFQNNTSTRMANTQLGLVAGRVHVADETSTLGWVAQETTNARRMSTRGPSREALSDLHLYKVPVPTDLEPHSVKNLQLFSLQAIPIRRRWTAAFWVEPERNRATRSESPLLELEFRNDAKSNAGVPLPAGTVRVMTPDQRGTPQLVATGGVLDTPEGEKVAINAGRVGDVRFVMKQTDYQSALRGGRSATFSLELRNRSRNGGSARVDLQAGGDVQLEVKGGTVSRPSAATWRLEVPLGAGEVKKIQVIARRSPRQRSNSEP